MNILYGVQTIISAIQEDTPITFIKMESPHL